MLDKTKKGIRYYATSNQQRAKSNEQQVTKNHQPATRNDDDEKQ